MLFKSQKHIFWQALVLTLIVFNIGVYLGYSLEAQRVNRLDKMYVQSELELLDLRIQDEILYLANIDCNKAIEANIKFGDKIYEEAKVLEKYSTANRFSEKIVFEHKKYDLLRTFFWMNSVRLKEKCNPSYRNVVYLYQYNEPSLEKAAKQKVFSNALGELKEKYGNNIMLIPIAGDMNLASINLLLDYYNVTEFPTILIDEKVKITEITSTEEIERYFK